jgi:ATP-dependent helicase/nuclease subunit A
MNGLTADQNRAISAEGDILVMAGAGTGKTRTLVERCLARMMDPDRPVSLDRMLMVTFTEAAAAEMRRRIRARLEMLVEQQPDAAGMAEQLALVDTARISTLHGFCLHLIRDHFHELAIDPELTVLSEEAAALLAGETLEELLTRCYRGEWGQATALQNLVWEHGRGWDGPVRELVLRLHRYTQTLRNPDGWCARELEQLAQPVPTHWEDWLREGFSLWRNDWLPVLQQQPTENTVAQRCAAILLDLGEGPERATIAQAVGLIAEVAQGPWPKGAKTRLRKPIEKFLDEARFLNSLSPGSAGVDPLHEDWQWARGSMTALIELTRQFGRDYAAAKRGLGALDFHDLEQFALRLLWNRDRDQPSALAHEWRARFDLVFVDEYQDINEAQDTILRALSRDGPAANRFLVGDVKQSIYRFRLANPQIFQRYARAWTTGDPHQQVLQLSDNFRSHEGIIEFVNRCFSSLMREELGGVTYDNAQQLRFGSPDSRPAMRWTANTPPPVELHLLVKGGTPANEITELPGDHPGDASDAEREALSVGMRLRDLHADRFLVWDTESGAHRPVEWRDMAILLRSPSRKGEAYAKVFESLGLPLLVGRGGFYESTEISDLLCLLNVLDNPLQDLPLLAVLRSPIVGLTPDDLATVRLASRAGYLWTALRRFHRTGHEPATNSATPSPQPAANDRSEWLKVHRFLASMRQWRRRARRESLSMCLESILDETGYEAWLSQTLRGTQRQANVRRLLGLTRQFDQFQRQGLFRFLRFIQAQRDAGLDAEPASPTPSESIRLLSIHQSKGLEFPVVVLADLGKPFNFSDLSERVILDEVFGLCPQVQPPHTGQRYPSLPCWLARRRQRRESLGEELRLLYVAATRACDLLILSGITRETSLTERWIPNPAAPVPGSRLPTARSCLDWFGAWLPSATGHVDWTQSGACSWLRWTVNSIESARLPATSDPATAAPAPAAASAAPVAESSPSNPWIKRVAWRYPHPRATRTPAKASVSLLRRQASDADDESWPLIPMIVESGGALTGADLGTAHHRFLELIPLDQAHEPAALRAEAERLHREGHLSADQLAVLDYDAMADFWRSDVGTRIRTHSAHVQRELPFTARFSLPELEQLGLLHADGLDLSVQALDEWMVVQGVVDLAVVLPAELWILDFKTDHVDPSALARKTELYRPQLQLYSRALARIYQRPVRDCWLHFIALRQSVPIRAPAEMPALPGKVN